jgi:hypothetical protein
VTIRAHETVAGTFPVFSTQVKELAQLPAVLVAPSPRFILLVAADTSGFGGAELVDLAGSILATGATYVCCWGPDCERFHDCFDESETLRTLDAEEDRVVMTTWHDSETLEEAIWFATHSAFPDAGYELGTESVIIATVGNDSWAAEAASYLDRGTPMTDEA